MLNGAVMMMIWMRSRRLLLGPYRGYPKSILLRPAAYAIEIDQ